MGHFFGKKIHLLNLNLLKIYKWFPLIILRTIYHKAFIFYMLISLGKDMTCIDFGFTRSRSQGSFL